MKIRFSLRHAGALAAVVALAVPATITARTLASGDLDTSFDSDGKATADFGTFDDAGHAVAIDGDGKIVVAGFVSTGGNRDFAVMRFTTSGALDSTWDGDGLARTPIGGGQDAALAVGIQSDGKVVAAGYAETRKVAIVRYNTDGSLDTTFGGDGIVTFLHEGQTRAYDLGFQSDGKIIVGGRAIGSNGIKFFAARLDDSDGSLDTSFGLNGKTSFNVGERPTNAFGLAIDGSDRILLAGRGIGLHTGFDFAVARLDANGALDTTFDTDGRVLIDMTGARRNDEASDVVIQSGKIVVGGSSFNRLNRWDFAAARLNDDGSLDTTFGGSGTGKIIFPVGASNATDIATAMALQSTGKIILVGRTKPPGMKFQYSVARLNADGTLDTTFSGDGVTLVQFGVREDRGNGVAVQSDDKIVVVGSAKVSRRSDVGVARLEG